MKFISPCFATLLLIGTAQAAEIDPSALVKVTSQNNPDCVEYYTYKGESYCSTKALQNEPVDPNLKSYEKQKIVFDKRAWQPVWGKKTPIITTLEYVPAGADINHWQELVTSQFIPNLENSVTPWQFAHTVIQGLKDNGFNPKITFLENTPDYVLFEFSLSEPANLVQDELQIIKKGKDGLYILHYAIKKNDMGKEAREQWSNNLKNSTIKK
jgi:hypothetical protein